MFEISPLNKLHDSVPKDTVHLISLSHSVPAWKWRALSFHIVVCVHWTAAHDKIRTEWMNESYNSDV